VVHPSTGQLTPRKRSRRRVTLLAPLAHCPVTQKTPLPRESRQTKVSSRLVQTVVAQPTRRRRPDPKPKPGAPTSPVRAAASKRRVREPRGGASCAAEPQNPTHVQSSPHRPPVSTKLPLPVSHSPPPLPSLRRRPPRGPSPPLRAPTPPPVQELGFPAPGAGV
jgi:hypothetical protein